MTKKLEVFSCQRRISLNLDNNLTDKEKKDEEMRLKKEMLYKIMDKVYDTIKFKETIETISNIQQKVITANFQIIDKNTDTIDEYDNEEMIKINNREEQKATKGKFRVIGVDTFDHDDWIKGDYDTFEEARAVADKYDNEEMIKMYIYDDMGKCLGEAGNF